MQLEFHQVDAFSNRPFGGNPAIVYRLDAWLADELMQRIAAEHNLAETAFLVREAQGWHIRWFTPTTEVNQRICQPWASRTRKAVSARLCSAAMRCINSSASHASSR